MKTTKQIFSIFLFTTALCLGSGMNSNVSANDISCEEIASKKQSLEEIERILNDLSLFGPACAPEKEASLAAFRAYQQALEQYRSQLTQYIVCRTNNARNLSVCDGYYEALQRLLRRLNDAEQTYRDAKRAEDDCYDSFHYRDLYRQTDALRREIVLLCAAADCPQECAGVGTHIEGTCH